LLRNWEYFVKTLYWFNVTLGGNVFKFNLIERKCFPCTTDLSESVANQEANVFQIIIIIKLGGLDGRDQSRSRSRTSFVSRLTFENRRDYPSHQDQLLKVSRSRVSIEISTKIEILGHKPCRDFVF
jgi:hypothetical protein